MTRFSLLQRLFQKSFTNPFRKILALLIGVIGSGSVFFLWHQLIVHEQAYIQQLIFQEATSVKSTLNRELTARIYSLQRMAQRWEMNGGTPRVVWENDAKSYLEHFDGYQAIEWVDREFKVRWIVPLAGNEAAQNLELSKELRRQVAIAVANELRQPIATGTMTLIQRNQGFWVSIPLFIKSESPTASFDGFILGVFKFPDFFDGVLPDLTGYNLSISDRSQVIYQRGKINYSLFCQSVFIQAHDVNWNIKICPNAELLERLRSPLIPLLLIGGLILVWLLVLIVDLTGISYEKVFQFKQTNQQLKREINQRQKIEQALKLSQSRFAGILDIAEEAIISINEEQHITLFNQGAEKIFGYTAQEVIGQPLILLIPEYFDQLKQDFHLESEEDSSVIFSHQLLLGKRKNNQVFSAEASTSRLKLNNEIILTTFLRDITERQNNETALARLAAIVESSEDAIISKSLAGIITSWNASAERIFGYTAAEIIGQPITALIPPEELSHEQKIIDKIKRGETISLYDTVRLRKDRTLVDLSISISPLKDSQGKVIGASKIAREISQRKQAEEALRQSEERWELALKGNNDGIWDWNVKTNEVFFSPRWKEMLGYADHEIENNLEEWSKRVHPEDLEWVIQAVQDHFSKQTPYYLTEHRVLCKDGSYKWILDRGQAIWDEQGNPIRMVGSHTDVTERKRAEAELKEMSQVMENVISGISQLDRQGCYVYVNKSYAEINGYTPEAMIGMNWEVTVHPDNLDKLRAAYQEMLISDNIEVEGVGIRPNGAIFYKHLVMIARYDHQGQFLGHYCFMKDISDRVDMENRRKQAEERLRQSEATKQAIIEAIPDLLIRMKDNGEYLDFIASKEFNVVNPYTLRANVNIYDILPRDLAQTRLRYTQRALQSQMVQLYEQEIIIQDRICHEEVRIVPLQQDEVLIMIRDISDRKQAELELRHQKEMFQAMVTHIPAMIALGNSEGKIQFINLQLEQVLGWTDHNWREKNFLLECYPDPEIRQRVLEHIFSATGKWKDFATRTASGKYLETTWANVRLSNGYILGIGQDISDRKRREFELQHAVEAAEAANLAKSLFLANMSHELRTPLNVILGFAQVMEHDPDLTPNQQEDLRTIRRSGDHLLSLINDVLDLSKIEAGHCTLEETGFDLIALLHSLRTMLAERMNAKRLQFELEIDPQVPQFIITDAQKLRQILLNLLSNAIKFTQQGQICLQVQLQAESLSNFPPNRQVLAFKVTDTGVGIAPEEREKIFDAFVQAKAGKQTTNGTGLGLTISRKLLELMGGKIFVESTPGQGSTFSFTLPVYPTSGVNISSIQSNRSVIGLATKQSHHRILVVDDQLENRLLLTRLLTWLGFEVQEASNGEDAVQLWQQWQPDLTFMDIRMPIVDGYEATRQIRALETARNSIIIALTAQASQSDRTLALAAGCNDYISKPFREETLFLKLSEYLGVEYLYDEVSLTPTEATASESFVEPTQDLAVLALPNAVTLSTQLLQDLEDASICGDDLKIIELTAQFPEDLVALQIRLNQLADQYQFEQIIELLKQLNSSVNP